MYARISSSRGIRTRCRDRQSAARGSRRRVARAARGRRADPNGTRTAVRRPTPAGRSCSACTAASSDRPRSASASATCPYGRCAGCTRSSGAITSSTAASASSRRPSRASSAARAAGSTSMPAPRSSRSTTSAASSARSSSFALVSSSQRKAAKSTRWLHSCMPASAASISASVTVAPASHASRTRRSPDRMRRCDTRDEAVERVRIVVVDVARRPRLVGIHDEGQQLEPASARDVVLELGVRALVALRPAAVAMGEQATRGCRKLDLTTTDVRRGRALGRELLHVHGLKSDRWHTSTAAERARARPSRC
ncbi:MAG: hypothetical protein QOG94_3826 [Solirubrobacteraceae bacterium]|nr:hypothetical protein [Solirubrobacteraceae bacterium]